jgi:hypothetical protein
MRKTGRIHRASNEKDGEDSSRIKSERRGGFIAHQVRKTGRIHRSSGQKDGEDSSRIKSERRGGLIAHQMRKTGRIQGLILIRLVKFVHATILLKYCYLTLVLNYNQSINLLNSS